jgi:pyrroline-5-carboxylate reductase
MPNIAAEFGESMTFVEEAEQAETAAELFGRVGLCKVVLQRQMAAGMMMAGCGIAYVVRFLRAMMEGGVEMGFYPDEAKEIAMQTMQGAVTMLRETGLHPEAAIDKVTTPGGITIKGLNELDHAAFNSAVIRCLKAGLK